MGIGRREPAAVRGSDPGRPAAERRHRSDHAAGRARRCARCWPELLAGVRGTRRSPDQRLRRHADLRVSCRPAPSRRVSYAQVLYTLPVSLFGMSVSAAELPAMAGATGEEGARAAELRARLTAGLRQIAFFVVPSAVIFLALGDVVTSALYQTGEFTRDMALYVWGILAGAAVGLLPSTLGRLYASTYYALHDTRTPLRFALIRVGLSLAPRIPVRGQTSAGSGAGAAVGGRGTDPGVRARRLGGVLPAQAAAAGPNREDVDAVLLPGAGLGGGRVGGGSGLARAHLVPVQRPLIGAIFLLGTFGLVYLGVTTASGLPEARRCGRTRCGAGSPQVIDEQPLSSRSPSTQAGHASGRPRGVPLEGCRRRGPVRRQGQAPAEPGAELFRDRLRRQPEESASAAADRRCRDDRGAERGPVADPREQPDQGVSAPVQRPAQGRQELSVDRGDPGGAVSPGAGHPRRETSPGPGTSAPTPMWGSSGGPSRSSVASIRCGAATTTCPASGGSDPVSTTTSAGARRRAWGGRTRSDIDGW